MRYWLACLFISTSFTARSQQVIKEYEIREKYFLDDVELLSFEDTLIVNLSLRFQGVSQLATFLVPRDMSFLSMPNLHGTNKNAICGVESLPGGIKRFYYADQAKSKFTIQAIEADFKKRSTIDFPGELVLNGKMLTMLTDDNQVVIFSYDKGTIYEVVIDGLKASSKKSYQLPESMTSVNARDVTLCVEGDHVGVVEAKSNLKIFLNDEWITAVHDNSGYSSTHTAVTRFERSSGKVVTQTIPTKGKFSSTILDTLVYRTINGKSAFKLEIFGVNSASKIHEYNIAALPANEEQLVYFREGRANTIGKIETLKHMMKTSPACEPFVVAQYQGNTTVLTWGTYFDDNGAMGPGGLDPITGMAKMIIGTTIKQIAPGPGVSRYFYLQGNLNDGFTLNDNSDCLRARVDAFETAQQKDAATKRKSYFKINGDIVAAYYLSKSNKLIFVKFSR